MSIVLRSASWGSLECQLSASLRTSSGAELIEMEVFLWVLEAGGVSIVLIGLQRERWLQHRRR